MPVAHWLGRRLKKPASYDPRRDRPLPHDGRWPKAARFDGDQRRAVLIGTYPCWNVRSPLAEFLKYPGKPLSARATRGFLARTERASLRFAPGFQERLRLHLLRMEEIDADGDHRFAHVAAE
jgi:DNA (cytosine-5)-methyltransferase 1